MADPIVGDNGLRVIFTGEGLMVALELVDVSEVVVLVDVFARYNKDRGI